MSRPKKNVLFLNGDPILWFFPYLAVYLLAAKTKLSVATVTWIFAGLHAAVLGALVWVTFKNLALLRQNASLVFFFAILFLLFLFPGAYLEYPSDPWEHFRRIFAWSHYSEVAENPLWVKFAYFFNYSLLQWLPLESRRVGLDGISTFWQLLLSWQFFRLARALGCARSLAVLQVIGVIALFGHNLFSFRYYALSSTPLAFAAFLSIGTYLLRLRSGAIKLSLWSTVPLGCLFLLMLFNHVQEILLTGVFAVGVWGEYRGWFENRKKVLLVTFLGFWIASYVFFQQPSALAWIQKGYLTTRAYDPFLGGWLSKWGVFRLWKVSGHYFQTYGVHGVASLALAALYYRQYPRLAALTLAPTVLMLFPPFVILLSLVTELPNSYRVLFAFPTSFLLVSWCYSHLSQHWGRKTAFAGVLSLVVALGLLSDSPWRGRLAFQLTRTSPLEDLRYLDPLVSWLKRSGPHLKTTCNVFSDNLTAFLLATHFGTGLKGIRTYPGSILSETDDVGHFWQFVDTYKACLVVFYDQTLFPEPFTSYIAESSGHWTPQSQNLSSQIHPHYAQFESLLEAKGWQRWSAPPFYRIYIQNPCHYSQNPCL